MWVQSVRIPALMVYETSYEERQNSAKGVCSSINMYGIKSSSLFPHLSRFDTTAKFCQLQDCKDSGLRQGFYVSELHTMLTKTLIQASININRLNTFRQLLNERDLCNLSLCDVSRSSPDCCFTDAHVLSDSLIKPVSIKITEAGSPTPHGDLQKYTSQLTGMLTHLTSPLKLLKVNQSHGVNRGASLTSAGMATSAVIERATASTGVVHNVLFHGVIATEGPPLHEDEHA
ncbi:hypothetical protein Bca52824_002266 [Brassica carinata]|uniref:Uncharacterized protein n=1 Tax=Brassica carinata TaxID=52824 RepID=A0A8X7WKC4_BRACI|nr:hypothetical protein Bca52824_002266 [Brassica carinata]